MLSLTWSYMGFNLNLFKKFMEETNEEIIGNDSELDATEEATPATEEEATEEDTEDTE